MAFDLQTFVVLTIVAAAACYLARRSWLAIARRKGCGACGTCPAGESNGSPTLVTLETVNSSARRLP